MLVLVPSRNLINMDTLSKSDPQVYVYTRTVTNSGASEWSEVGHTEMINDNLNPSFVTSIRMRYTFEVTQYLRFVVYDIDDVRAPLAKQDLIGATETTLAAVVSAGGCFRAALENPELARRTGRQLGTISVAGEEVKETNTEVQFDLSARNLDKKDVFGKSDPFVVISQSLGTAFAAVYRTETIMKTLNPAWRPFTLPAQRLCNGDQDRPILFECFDWNKRSPPELIGRVQTTLRQLGEPGALELELVLPKKAGKRGYKNSGVLVLSKHDVVQVPTFLDYIRGGCEINMVCAIDFTASNGDPRVPASLHALSPDRPNAYEMAIRSVGSIIACYDHRQRFPVYGYGARMPNGETSHCFALNGNPANPEVPGVQGILDAYHLALRNVTLYGPTRFAPVITNTCEIIKMNHQSCPQQQKYYILLIITDGAINDMNDTIRSIVYAANNLPLSIVIVGVGNSPEFKSMEVLDGDDRRLCDQLGNVASRDIVQFVPFNQFAACPERLAQETLAEIPQQLVSFMRARSIAPLPPVQGPPPGADGVPQPGMPQPQPGMPQPDMSQPQPGMPPQGMPPQGMPPQGMPQPGMPPQGMPPQGMPQPGMPSQ